MANTTKKSVTQKSTAKKVEEKVNSTDNGLVEENALLKKQLEEMMSNYKDMQLQLQNMLIAQQAQNTIKEDKSSCLVGCRIFNGVTLASQSGDISIPLAYREEAEISYSELREIFKNSFGYKNMFKKGILYFVDSKEYKTFGITKDLDISDEGLIELINKENNFNVIETFKKMTNDKKDLSEVFAIIYQIAYLIDNRKIDLDYEYRQKLEEYFGVGFSELINNLHA